MPFGDKGKEIFIAFSIFTVSNCMFLEERLVLFNEIFGDINLTFD